MLHERDLELDVAVGAVPVLRTRAKRCECQSLMLNDGYSRKLRVQVAVESSGVPLRGVVDMSKSDVVVKTNCR